MNNTGELALIISDNNELLSLPNDIPSQYFTLNGYQLHFSNAAAAQAAGGLVYLQIEDYLSFNNVLDTNPSFCSIPLTYRHEPAAGTTSCFVENGLTRHYKTSKRLQNTFRVKLFNAAKTEIADADILRFVIYFTLDQSQVFTG